MEILARDHLADARLGPLCLKLVYYPSPRREVPPGGRRAESGSRRAGRATLALAQYLKMKGEFVGEPEEVRRGTDGRLRREVLLEILRAGVPGTAPRSRSAPDAPRGRPALRPRVRRLRRYRLHSPTISLRGRPSPTSPIASGRPGDRVDRIPREQFRTIEEAFSAASRPPTSRGREPEEGRQGRAGRGQRASLHRGLSEMARLRAEDVASWPRTTHATRRPSTP